MRRANRKDGNHREIINQLKSMGWFVTDVSDIPKICDIRIDRWANGRSISIVVEIKDGEGTKQQRRLTKDEELYLSSYPGHFAIIENEKDCIAITKIALDDCYNEYEFPIQYKYQEVLER